MLDTSKDGLVSFPEFASFEGLLCSPDALYKTAFQLFDTKGTGTVGFGGSLCVLGLFLFFKVFIFFLLGFFFFFLVTLFFCFLVSLCDFWWVFNALYKTAFQLFDTKGTGTVGFGGSLGFFLFFFLSFFFLSFFFFFSFSRLFFF